MPVSILVIGFGGKGVGDQVIATPFIRNLARNLPDARIDFAASSQAGVELLRHDPHIHDCFLLDMDCFRLGGARRFDEKLAALRRLRHGKYDRVYLLTTKLRPAIAAFFAGRAERIGYASYHREFLLTRCWNEPEEKNIVDRFLDLLALDGMPVDSDGIRLYLLEEELFQARRLREELFPASMPVVALAPFAADMRRTWGLRSFGELAGQCRAAGYGVVILGSPADVSLLDDTMFPADNRTANLVGKLSLRQTAALISQADAFVGNDSGLGHVAGAVGTKGIVIGYHVTKVWYPVAPCIRTIIRDPGCTGCNLVSCVGNSGAIPPCFRAISVSEVLSALQTLVPDASASLHREGYEGCIFQ